MEQLSIQGSIPLKVVIVNAAKDLGNSYLMAAVLESDIGGTIYQIVVPSTDADPLQEYSKHLSTRGVPMTSVVTEISLGAYRTMFKPARSLEDSEHEITLRQSESAAAKQAVCAILPEDDPLSEISEQLKADGLTITENKDEPVVIPH